MATQTLLYNQATTSERWKIYNMVGDNFNEEKFGYGDWMREQRLKKGFSQQKLAELIALDDSVISRWESEDARPTRSNAINWANAINPGDEDFLRETLIQTGYSRIHIDSNIVLTQRYALVIHDLLGNAEHASLNLVAAFEDELLRFADIWNQCMELRIFLLDKKQYSYAIQKITGILRESEFGRNLSPIEPRTRAYLLDMLGNAYYHLGEIDLARLHLNTAIDIGHTLRRYDEPISDKNRAIAKTWKQWLATVHDHQSDVLRVLGSYSEAKSEAEQARILCTEIGDIPNQVRAIRKTVLVDLVRGAKANRAIELCGDSLKLLQQAVTLDKQILDYEIAKTYATRGWAKNVYGDLDGAREDHRAAIKIWTTLGEKAGVKYELMKCYRYLGDDHEQAGNISDAERNYKLAFNHAQELGKDLDAKEAEIGMILLGLAKVEISKGAFERAHTHLEQAYQSHQHSKDRIREAIVLRSKAKLELTQRKKGAIKRAIEHYANAVRLLGQVNAHGYEVGTLIDYAAVLLAENDEVGFNNLMGSARELLITADEPLDDSRVRSKYQMRYLIVESLSHIYFHDNLELAINCLLEFLQISENLDTASLFYDDGTDRLSKLGRELFQRRDGKEKITKFARAISQKIRYDENITKAATYMISK